MQGGKSQLHIAASLPRWKTRQCSIPRWYVHTASALLAELHNPTHLEASVLRLTAVKSRTVANNVPTIHADNLRCSIGVAGANLNGVGWLRDRQTVCTHALDRISLNAVATSTKPSYTVPLSNEILCRVENSLNLPPRISGETGPGDARNAAGNEKGVGTKSMVYPWKPLIFSRSCFTVTPKMWHFTTRAVGFL